jgi:hypothetical protein
VGDGGSVGFGVPEDSNTQKHRRQSWIAVCCGQFRSKDRK